MYYIRLMHPCLADICYVDLNVKALVLAVSELSVERLQRPPLAVLQPLT